jgi:hypothetical protein
LGPNDIHTSQFITVYPLTIEQALDDGIDLSCDVAICGVDNNPARAAAS